MNKFSKETAKNFYFTSDTHFNHENILSFCNRPFSSIREHDECLIKNWNEKVPKDGIVFHLGDVGFGNNQYIKEILDQLNGEIWLVVGNHDMKSIISQHKKRFHIMAQQMSMTVGNQIIIMNHCPLLCFAGSYKKNPAWQLFGHVHSGPRSNKGLDLPRLDVLFPTQYDVGVDNNNYTPISYEELETIMKERVNNAKL